MIIRRLEERDLSIRVSWMNNPKIYTSMHFAIPVTLENTIQWFENNKGKDSRTDVVFEDAETGELLAMGGLTGINRDANKAELYIFVNPDLHRGGIGTIATKLLCKYGFERLNLDKIYLETNENNVAAQKVYFKCGFHLEGIHRGEYRADDGRLLSRMYFGMLKGELNE